MMGLNPVDGYYAFIMDTVKQMNGRKYHDNIYHIDCLIAIQCLRTDVAEYQLRLRIRSDRVDRMR
jgi:hypothetical protein